MKKIVTCIAFAALAAGSALNASVSLTDEVGSVSLDGILSDSDNAPSQNVMAYSGTDLYVSGLFDTAFGGLTPTLDAGEAYIIKYDQGMQEQWKVQLEGAANVTAMLADGNGGVYVAGVYADEVVMGSTDSNSQIIAGFEVEDGVYSTYKAASFVAHYDTNGSLLAVGTVVPTHDPALDETGMYFPEDNSGDTYFAITKLLDADGSLYAVGTLKGQIANADGSETATSGSYDLEGWGIMFMPTMAGVVVGFDNSLAVESIPVVATGGDFTVLTTSEELVSISAATSGAQLYVGLLSTGTLNVKAFDATYSAESVQSVGSYNLAYSLMSVDLSQKSSNFKQFGSVETNAEYVTTEIDNMELVGENLIVAGRFQTAVGFDQTTTVAQGDDMYVAAINASTLEAAWSVATGYDEGDSNTFEEAITGSLILSDVAYLYGSKEQKSDRAKQESLHYAVDLGNGTLSSLNPSDYIFGMAGNSARVAVAHTSVPVSGITFTAYGESTGIDGIAAGGVQQVAIYPNPVTSQLNFSQPCDVQVYSLDGKLVLDADNVTSLDVTGLTNGAYIVKTITEGETSFSKVLKN